VVGSFPFLSFPLLIECKERFAKLRLDQVIYLEKDWISKIEKEASEINALPILIISFKRKKNKRIWCIFQLEYFKLLFNFLPQKYVKMVERKNIIVSYNKLRPFSIVQYNDLVFVEFSVFIERLKELNNGV
jgi:hypothetical protein